MPDPYIGFSELSAYLKIGVAGNEGELEVASAASCSWVDRYAGRTFGLEASASARVFDATSHQHVDLDDIGHATIAVATDDAQDGGFATAWLTSDFQALPFSSLAKGMPVTSLRTVGTRCFPRPCTRAGLVRVTARWGWPAVPDDVKLAALIQAARLYKRRESAEGVLGNGDFGVVRVGNRVDPDVAALLGPYRKALVA